jgi:predicted Fe-Mo cluster-binding NifX family protein
MKVCIPTIGENGLDNLVSEHFGRSQTYTIVDLDTQEVRVIPNASEHMGGQGYPPELLAQEGVNVMICRGLGRRAIMMFEEFKIDVYIGATGKVRDAVAAFKENKLQKANIDTACQQHAFRDQHHHGDHEGHCH